MRILIVDDSQGLRALLAEALLSLFDWEVLQAEGAEEALAVLSEQHHPVDAILLDQIMPMVDGLHLLPKLLEIRSMTPVIMMTAHGSIHLATEFMKKGGAGFIEKPITHFDILKLRIEEAIKNTRRKKELENISATQHASEILNKQKSTLLSNISNELRTPISQIFPFATLTKRKLLEEKPEEAMQMLNKLLAGQARMLRFVTNIEHLVQIYTEKFVFQPTPSDLVQQVHNSVQKLTERGHKKQLRWSISKIKTLEMFLDENSIQIALEEILMNAIKFSPKGGTIEIVITLSNGKAQVSILDTGPGLPSGEEEQVFFPFCESSYTASDAGGTGLGLSVARGMVHMHGGTIHAENRQDTQGAIVTLSLPTHALNLQLGHGHEIYPPPLEPKGTAEFHRKERAPSFKPPPPFKQ